jgi:DNA segregation ATPase FtsK/SpoIIIE, S-DNA-T family
MKQEIITLDRLYGDADWQNFAGKPIIPIGAETATHNLIGNLENNFNLLIGGKTGSGKSNFFHCAIASLLKNTEADELKFILIDTKRVELVPYNNLPNLVFPVAVTYDNAKEALQWCLDEIEKHTQLMIEGKNENQGDPRIVIIIDEFSDLMIDDFEFFKKAVMSIVENGYLAKINIMVSTSKILEEIYPKDLVVAFRHRISFATYRAEDSKLVLGFEGAEKLIGDGDLLMIHTEIETPVHAQGFYISEEDIEKTKEQYIQKYTFKPQSLLFKFLWKFFPAVVDHIGKIFQVRTKK